MELRKRKKRRKYFLLVLSIAGLFCFWMQESQAQEIGPSIAVVPHTFDLSVEKGEQINDRVKIYNRGQVAVPFRIKIVDFGAVEETGEMTMIEPSDSNSSATSWFEFEKQDFIVDAGQKEELNFSINVPEDAEPQGYYAMLMLEADISTYLFNESKVQVIPSMGVLFMLKVEGGLQTDEPLTILEYSVLEEYHLEGAEKVANFLAKSFVADDEQINVIKSQQPTFLVKIKNNDPYHKKLTGDIKLSGVGWKLEDELEVQPITILPGMTRKILVKGVQTEEGQIEGEEREKEGEGVEEKKGSFGFMQANLKIEEEQGFTKQRQQLIIVFSWKMVVLFLLAIVLMIFPVWIVRKKRRKIEPKPKLKKHSPEATKKSEGKMPDNVETETEITGSENVQSEKIEDFWKEHTAVSPGATAKKKIANKKIATRKSVVKKSTRRKAKKSSIKTKQQTRKTTARKITKKKAVPRKRTKTLKRKIKKTRPKAKTRQSAALKKRPKRKKATGKKVTKAVSKKKATPKKKSTRKKMSPKNQRRKTVVSKKTTRTKGKRKK